jgi:hypothetical protein
MERMLCEQCAAESFSAAARQLVDRGERCPRCGGELRLADTEPPVGIAPKSPAPGDRATE